MVEFGEQFLRQNACEISTFCVVCLHALGKFERHEWATRLLAIGIDSVPRLSPDEMLFGNILFFREDDREFLPSLNDWLKQILTCRWAAARPELVSLA
jgi:hypothetical protein